MNFFQVMHLRQVGGDEEPLDPVDLVDAFGELVGEAKPLADLVEDLVVGLGFPERLDALVLEDDDAVVELLLAVMPVAAEPCPLAHIERSKLVQAGRITSANCASPSNQMLWFTTNSRSAHWYVSTQRLVLFMVREDEPPYLYIMRTCAYPGAG